MGRRAKYVPRLMTIGERRQGQQLLANIARNRSAMNRIHLEFKKFCSLNAIRADGVYFGRAMAQYVAVLEMRLRR